MNGKWNITSLYPRLMSAVEFYKHNDLKMTEELKTKLNSIWGGYHYTTKCKFDYPDLPLTKCFNCVHCFKRGDGTYICKYSVHGGKCERATCHYERKTN